MKHQKSNKTVYKVLAVIFGLIFLVCVIWLISYFIGLKQAQKELEREQQQREEAFREAERQNARQPEQQEEEQQQGKGGASQEETAAPTELVLPVREQSGSVSAVRYLLIGALLATACCIAVYLLRHPQEEDEDPDHTKGTGGD